GLVSVRIDAGVVEDRYAAGAPAASRWMPIADGLLVATQTDHRSLARLYRARSTDVSVVAMSTVVSDERGHPRGAMVLLARCRDAAHADGLHAEFRALAALVSGRVPDAVAARGQASANETSLSRAIQRAATYASLPEFAIAITNNLRNKIGCEQVALGGVRRRRVRLIAISGFDDVKPRSPGTLHIRQAMEECLDSVTVIVRQIEEKWSGEPLSSGHRLHRRWHEATGNAAVVSIPLVADGVCVAVLSLRRDVHRPFTSDEIAGIRQLVEPFAPAFALIDRAGRSLPAHAVDRVRRGARWLVAPTGWGRKVVLLALVAFAYWFVYGTVTYEITVPCTIQPRAVRHFAAPIEGVIDAVEVEAGDRVRAGDVLVRLDTRTLELQREQLDSEARVSDLHARQAIAAGDVTLATLANAELDVLRAQIAVLDHRIDLATIRAGADGIVLTGDLRPRLGQLVRQGEPLVSIAPPDGWQLDLELPEASIAHLEPGMRGRFASHARPEALQDCRLTRIRPVAIAREGRTIFIADGEFVDPDAPWMRPGVSGVARLDAGPRPVWWIALHRVIDAAAMRFWL
ncbi:MAG: HlyD family efflux transporter periplasmic adaptor subunit, partial [Phycisphaerales bacterium]|nr:HlyD family efflux transporter periplasmic adaptor subunit [Phycisphaerales bacterium]